jgi:hypothetical protein
MAKPAAAPMPRTGGGMNTSTCASSICASRTRISWATLSMVWPLRWRSSKSSSTRNSRPALVAAVNVAALRPAKPFEYLTPGVASEMSVARRSMASVRANDAPGGSCREMIMIARSRLGMNPVGRRATNQPAKASRQT